MVKKGLPYHTIRGILKTYIANDVSREYVISVTSILEDIIESIAIASLNELNRVNELRILHNLRPLKRLHITQLDTTKYLCKGDNIGVANQDSTNSETDLSIGRSYT